MGTMAYSVVVNFQIHRNRFALLYCSVYDLYDSMVHSDGHTLFLESKSSDCDNISFYGKFPAFFLPWK